jgi:FAD/FMN-containing dehydrogenase
MVMTPAWRKDYESWGAKASAEHRVYRPSSISDLRACLPSANNLSMLPFGNGRSYGDLPLNPGGALIDCRDLDRLIAFDPATGDLTCEAGVTLAEIMAVMSRPARDGSAWMLPVTPGTRFVTVGGCIANDVHGKNHHSTGTFGRHVKSLTLMRGDGEFVTCSPTDNSDLFAATVGGLGLTGVIVRATLSLQRALGSALEIEHETFDEIAGFLRLSSDASAWDYTAAWIDCAAPRRLIGRGIFSRGRHVAGSSAAPPPRDVSLSIPVTPPASLVTQASVRAFNALYARKLGPRGRRREVGSYRAFLYPLDAIGHWNRLYGPAGFRQFQCVVPQGSEDVIEIILREISASGQGSMLAVLKVFGDLPSPGLLSFPMPGLTLALDFPNRGAPTLALLSRLEQRVVRAGGRIYPAKDSCMTPATFAAGYPAASIFRRWIDPRMSSAFARRVGLVTNSEARP